MLHEEIGSTKRFRELIDTYGAFYVSILSGRYFFTFRKQRSNRVDKDEDACLRRECGSVCNGRGVAGYCPLYEGGRGIILK